MVLLLLLLTLAELAGLAGLAELEAALLVAGGCGAAEVALVVAAAGEA